MNMGLGAKITIAATIFTILGMFGSGVWTMSSAFHRLQVLESDKSDITQVQKDIDELGVDLEKGLDKINNRISAQWPKVGDNMRAINRLETWRTEVARDVRENERRIDLLRDR